MADDGFCCCRSWRLRHGGVLAAVIVVASHVPGAVSVPAQDPDLPEIAQALQAWRASFVNLRVVHERWGPKWLKDPEAARPLPGDRFFRDEWVWADVGAFRTEKWLYEEGRIVGHSSWAANGPTMRHFRARYDKPGEPDFLGRLEIGRMDSALPASPLMVTPLAILYAPLHCEWLGDALAQGRGTLEEYEAVDGARCARIRMDNPGLVHIVWLDPAHDFLVRRVRPDPEKPETGFLFDVEEFQRAGGVWFPKRGTLGYHGDKPGEGVHWVVTEVALNEPLRAGFFEPPAPQIGTVVAEPNGRVYRYGEKRPGETREREIAEQARANVPEAAQPVSAVPPLPPAIWWSRVLLLGSTLLLLFGVAAWAGWRRWR